MPIFKSSEADIYYEIHGSGPPLLMVAGMASDSKSWQFILKEMSSHFRLIIFDNRGCGRTIANALSFDLRDLARDAFALLDFLDYDRVHLLGHSMGGMAMFAWLADNGNAADIRSFVAAAVPMAVAVFCRFRGVEPFSSYCRILCEKADWPV
mgnify:CR=1 FL=1